VAAAAQPGAILRKKYPAGVSLQTRRFFPNFKFRVGNFKHFGTILLPPRAQLCNRSCNNKHTHTHQNQVFMIKSGIWWSNSGFTRAIHWCIALGVEVAASFSKYVRSDRKFKINVWFYCTIGSWVSSEIPPIDPVRLIQKETQKPHRTDQNIRTWSK